jgi:adenosine deaminase
VRDALDLLQVDRIDHGVRAIDDPAVVQRLAADDITLNVCLSSNLMRLYPDLVSHPFLALHQAGVPVTLNTDDPGYLGIDLTGEFVKAASTAGWGLAELAALTRRAIDAAFCPPATAARLRAAVDAYVAAHS